jgi:hypothetical protein
MQMIKCNNDHSFKLTIHNYVLFYLVYLNVHQYN